MIAKRRDVQEKPREEGAASRADSSGRTSKRRKGRASLSYPRGAPAMAHSLGSAKEKPIGQGVGSEEEES